MTAELSAWLTELGEAQPAIAAEVGAALVAVLECAEPAELGLAGRPTRPDPRETVEHGYQRLLMALQAIRQRSARVTDALTAAEQQLSARRAEGADPAEIGTLEAELAAARQSQERLTRRHQQLQHEVDAFRAAKETAKATYTAADAQLRIADALADMSEGDEATAPFHEFAAETASTAENVRLRKAARTAEARLRQLAGQSRVVDAPVAGLLELRADPLGTDTRILFVVEPADTVTLLAVLDGPDAVGQYGAEAVRLAGELLTEIREQGWPDDLDSAEIADADEFLARYFRPDEGSIGRRAALLASIVPLTRRREQQGLSITELAARSGLPAERVAAIEERGLRTAAVHEAVALARVLGGLISVPAEDSGAYAARIFR